MLALQELCMLSAFVHTVSDDCSVDSETSEDLALWYCSMGLWKLSPRMSWSIRPTPGIGECAASAAASHSHLGACYRKKKRKKILVDSSDATFSLGVFCFPCWVPFIFFSVTFLFFYFTCLLPIFWSQSFSLRCQFLTRGSLRFGSQYFFLDAIFSLGVFCFPFFGSQSFV